MIETTAVLLAVVLNFLFAEYRMHLRRLNSIPIRIHVNGTRGKSSVTRLTAGALHEHGLRTYAMTTGTLLRMIMQDGRGYPIYSPVGANTIEQLRIIALAAHYETDALVMECMAVQSRLQPLAELKVIRAAQGVIVRHRE